MKVQIYYTNDMDNKRIEELNSLEDLKLLIKKENNSVIVKTPFMSEEEKGIELSIEVYNDYRE